MNSNILGNRIKMLRQKFGFKQIDLAKKLNISNTTLSQYESGARIPSDGIKIKMADLFCVSVDYLLGATFQKQDDSQMIKQDADLIELLNDPELREIYLKLMQLSPEQRAEADSYLQYLANKNKG